MFSLLNNHPFAVDAHFESSIVLTFAVPKTEIKYLIPECLELDTYNNEWAFIAVAMVQTRGLRPSGFPAFAGNDFFLMGFRVFVRYTTQSGKRLRGLYILKSETDKKKMEIFGNIFTHYNYTTTDINILRKGDTMEISSVKSDFKIVIEEGRRDNILLPGDSPFGDWAEARKFAGPLPFTFTFNKEKNEVLIIEGVRSNWEPSPVNVLEYRILFLDNFKLKTIKLANAFIIHNIPYHWKKGKTEKWMK